MMVTTDTAVPRSDGKVRGEGVGPRVPEGRGENEIEERETEPLCRTVRGV